MYVVKSEPHSVKRSLEARYVMKALARFMIALESMTYQSLFAPTY